MLHIFHGEKIIESRRELDVIKEKFAGKEIITLNGKKAALSDLKQALEAASLFGHTRLVIIEYLLKSLSKAKKEILDQYVEILQNSSHETVLWEDKEIGKILLKRFIPGTDIALFKPTKLLFRFLENITPQHAAKLLEILKDLVKKEAPELIFYMIIRQFRLLLLIKGIKDEKINNLSSWQRARLHSQAEKFTLEELQNAYARLFIIDQNQKSGKSPFNLTKDLELFLIQL